MTTMETTTSRKATVSCAFCGKLNRVDLARAGDGPKCGECGRPILLDRPVHLTDADFDRVVADAEVPVLVDFHAEWCGPCKMMAPILDEVARQRRGALLVAKVDTDHNPRTAAKYGIRSMPTFLIFKNGGVVGQQVGAVPRPRVEQLVDQALA